MDWWVFIIGAFNAATRAISCYPELVSNSLEFVACLFFISETVSILVYNYRY